MKTLLATLLLTLALGIHSQAAVRFEYRADQRQNPTGQTVLSVPFTLQAESGVGVVLTAQFTPTSETVNGTVIGQIRLDNGVIGGFAGEARAPQLIHVGTAMARVNGVDAGNHTVTANYTTFSNAITAITNMLVIYDDGVGGAGEEPTYQVGDSLLTLEEFLFYLYEELQTEIINRLEADATFQIYIDAIRDALEDRIAILEAQVAELLNQTPPEPVDLDALRAELIAYIDSVKTLLEIRIDALEAQLAELTNQVDAQGDLIVAISTQLQNNINALQVLLENRITNLEAQLALLVIQGNENGDLIIQVRNELQVAINNLQVLLEDRIAQLEILVASIAQSTDANAALIAQLQAALNALSNSLTALQANIESSLAQLALVDADLQAQIDALRNQLVTVRTDLEARIAVLEARLANLPKPQPAPVVSVPSTAPLASQLSAVETRLQMVEGRLNAHDARFKGLGKDDDDGSGIETYLIPAGIGLGTSVLVNALWPVPSVDDDDDDQEEANDPKEAAPQSSAAKSPAVATSSKR